MGKFVIKKVPTGYKFDLKTHAGETVGTSEVYTSKAACIKGVQGVIAVAPTAPQINVDLGEKAANPRFEVFRDKKGHSRYRLLARNGKIIAVSEGYMTAYGCDRAIEGVRSAVVAAEIEELV